MKNQPLPIDAFLPVILESVANNPVTIIVAETGAGKSTRVPRALLEAGKKVVVTQPRRLAAELVAERIASEHGTPIGSSVGYRLGGGVRVDSPKTRCLFITEGLALVRELMSSQDSHHYDALVLDEVHEWHEDMEVLVAWCRRALANGASFRLVLMSAILEAEKLSAYFGGAPIINVPGRTFPVTNQEPESLIAGDQSLWNPIERDVRRLVEQGRNVLVFVPGKPEIAQVCDMLKTCGAEVLPLHGELEKSERQKCFAAYSHPKVIVSTNVAQTSITIDDIDAVVDSGLERRVEVVNGVEGLRLRLISKADSAQRRGRAGRCRAGIYIDHSDNAFRIMPGVGMRGEFPIPEISRVLLDRAVLRLAMADLDLEDLDLFHAVSTSEVHLAKEVLRALGCLGDGIQVTEIGRRVYQLPIGIRSARMLIEAERRGCLSDVMTIAAILESGGIVDNKNVDETTGIPIWRSMGGDPTSDHLTMLRIYQKAIASKTHWRQLGLHGKGMKQAIDTRKALESASKKILSADSHRKGGTEEIIKSVLSGLVDQFRERTTNRWGEYTYGNDCRKLGQTSTVNASNNQWIVGMPFDISTKKGGILALLQFASGVKVEWVLELAPHLFTAQRSAPTYDPLLDQVTRTTTVRFRERVVANVAEPCDAGETLAQYLTEVVTFGHGFYNLPDSYRRALRTLEGRSRHAVHTHLRSVLNGVGRLASVQPTALMM